MEDQKKTHKAILQKRPIRLQEYGVGIFPTLSTKSALKKAIKRQSIYVNGTIATTATFIHGNEIITFDPPSKKQNKKEFRLSVEVVYEDDYVAIINKPPGILVSGNAFKTVANALEQNLEKSSQCDAVKPQPAHRLDYETTGLLLIGKTSTSIAALNKLFENKEIDKSYLAVTIGKMDKDGIISIPIDQKKAISHFEVRKSVTSSRFDCLNLVQLSPETGRRHQLRKHLSAIGNPILGDSTYGPEDLILRGKGLYLHAFSLRFLHPFTNEEICIKKEFPKKFRQLFPQISI